MGVPFNPAKLRYAVVEYLKTAQRLEALVSVAPENEGEYRLFCLLADQDDATQLVQALRAATADSPFQYSVCLAEAGRFSRPRRRPGHPAS
jgi:hypothetical protein